MRKEPDFSYVNEDRKLVSGAAAFTHHVYTEMGGVQNYNNEVGKKFIRHNSDFINKNLARQVRKNRLRKVG